MNDINPTTPQLKFVKAVSDAYLSHDLDKVKTFLSKDFTSQSFPKVAEYPDEAREEHLARWVSFFPLLTKSEANYHEVIEAPGKVVLHVTVVPHTVDGQTFEYDTVFVYTLTEEDGELKVLSLKDFADVEKRDKIFAWAKAFQAKSGPAA